MNERRFDIVTILARLRTLPGLGNDAAIAEKLTMSRTALAERKRRGSIPYEELVRFCDINSISINWLFYGEEPIRKEAMSLTVCEETAIYNDAELSEIIEWLRANPKDKKLMLKLVKVKKDVGEAFEGLEFKIILKEEE